MNEEEKTIEEIRDLIIKEVEIKMEETNRINKIAELIFQQYRNIPSDKLVHLVREFLENLKLLDDLYKK